MTEGLEAVVRRCSVKNVFLKLRKMCRKKINPSSLFERLSLQFYKETPREKKKFYPLYNTSGVDKALSDKAICDNMLFTGPYLGPYQISMTEVFSKNSSQLLTASILLFRCS